MDEKESLVNVKNVGKAIVSQKKSGGKSSNFEF